MERAAREFLRAVRGDRSQVAFARKLGYLGNPIADWEAGRRCPTAREALRACSLSNIDVQAAFARFHPADFQGAEQLGAWLAALKGSLGTTELATRAGYSRQQVARWLSGRGAPRLPAFFGLLQAITGRLCDLVAELVPIERVPSLKDDYQRRLAARRLAHEEPWTEAILRVLEIASAHAEPRYDLAAVSEALGLDIAIAERCLAKLQEAGIVLRSADHYEVVRSLTVDTRAIPQLKAHWSRVAAERLLHPRDDDVFCYNVLSASTQDVERIRQLLLATYREIRSIVSHTERDEAVALVNLQMVKWPAASRRPSLPGVGDEGPFFASN